jgi:hypothetical protein
MEMRAFSAGHPYAADFRPWLKSIGFWLVPTKLLFWFGGMEIRFPTPNALFWAKYPIALF